MPKHAFAEHQAERHLIYQGFQGAGSRTGMGKVGVRPLPEIAMAVAAVVSLDAEADGLAFEFAPIEDDLAGEDRIRMRRAGKTDPAFAAQGGAKAGTIAQLPGDFVSAHVQAAAAGVLRDGVLRNRKIEWAAAAGAELQSRQRETLDETLRLTCSRKPSGPYLDRQAGRIARAAAPPGIHQQIAKPPGAAAIGQAEAHEPHLVAAAHGQRGVNPVQCGHEEKNKLQEKKAPQGPSSCAPSQARSRSLGMTVAVVASAHCRLSGAIVILKSHGTSTICAFPHRLPARR